ncbi:type II toxin-antitoxin system VapC family toxin [Bradyrhizobium archetypum]|uniref:Type II toxin-antitoxin system VapC family toxin n=1 Tax=Bradyrhizobium archetypum TaxID=2721160 RepID=A0A7Y4M503_9BRAD|nr:PIN domain-containing protein [Bradyrhizobium archetypum]NOJ49635.1 type II toxin-antitoxin system VapC family toxin [Bradyrhizobium archetypum]
MTLVDSNVLLDIFIQTPGWWEWSLARLEDAARQGPLLINDVIFAETSIRFPVIEDFEAALSQAGINVAPMPRMALFLAGKASIQYRNAGGVRGSVLPDFFIGAHATVEQLPLLTRDTRRYRTYFPTVTLIAPNSETGA